MAIVKKGSAQWSGGIKDGKGTISTESGALNAQPYGFAIRFEGVKGSNPEELIAASHASCFTMALSLVLEKAGFKADNMDTVAAVTLDKDGEGFAVTKSELTLKASIPGISEDEFQKAAADAKANCPISKLLNAEITLNASLV
ncbi:OsmC family protein [Falsirhodobacter sp. 20TX0035]|uniref:OsmC family protein n=1 Tax=Falsirhodobacter sp. 20TX0035 TaxID=3022019 RepID=UPI00232C2B1D|nr:OsmC family protein [Falsirhodobacter sp. 20TX0035]MDB6452375.1 OsmC family protein [Falsirhodobacter sp. 20TX0035]